MTAHRSQLITRELVAAADLIVVMSAEQAVTMRQTYGPLRGTLLVLGDLDPARITRRTILDPWGGALSMFDESYERIDRCLGELVRLHAASASNAPQC